MPRPRPRRPSKVSDEQLLDAATVASTMQDLLSRLGLSVAGGNYESIRWRLHQLEALDERFLPGARRAGARASRADHRYSDAALREAAVGARTKADILRALGLPADAGHYRELNRRLSAAAVDVSHLHGRGWRRGRAFTPRVELQLLLSRRRVYTNTLRQRLIREGVFEPRCSCCGRTEWNGRTIPLELDHVNGDRADNRLENLRLLCPNCHAQTETWRGRNIGTRTLAFACPPEPP